MWILDRMADCLKQAQNFMLVCEQSLANIDSACAVSKTTALSKIQSAAKSNRARAIYRAAQDAIATVDEENAFARQLNTLMHLLSKYQSGVTELEGYEGDNTSPTHPKTNLNNEPQMPSAEALANIQINVPESSLTDDARQTRAITALCSSLSFSSKRERPALSTLISLATQQKNRLSEANLAPKEESKTSIKPITDNKHVLTDDKTQALDTIMPDLIHDGLCNARLAGLTLSLSYDVDQTYLSSCEMKDITPRLKKWLKQLVIHISSRSKNQSLAHIDISAQDKKITLTTKTAPIPQSILLSARDTKLVLQKYDAKTKTLRLVLHLKEKDEKTRIKSKSIPVEAGIAKRLDALMSTESDLIVNTPLVAS